MNLRENISLLLALFLFTVLLYSCKKEDANPYPISIENIAGSYKLTAFSLNGEDLFNTPALFPICEKDDVYAFALNGSFVRSEGMQTCDPSSSRAGTWHLENNNFFLDSVEYQITGLTPSVFEMEFREIDSLVPGDIEVWKYSFSRQ